MNYGSVCSGIEAATQAWHPLGWTPSFFSEIEQFPREVLAHHYPQVPLHGDFTTIQKGDYEPIELLVGGTPCQSFSVAGLRAGLADPRGNLMLEFGALAHRLRPTWLVWENVPGVLSSNGGGDFGSFLGMLAELGYGFAYRVLDAKYFGVAQRRRRVFVVGYLGSWQRAAAVLFERDSLSRNPAPSRKKGKEVTEIAGTLTSNGGGLNRPAGNANELDFCVAVNNVQVPVDDVAQTLTKSPSSFSSYNPARQEGNAVISYALAGNTIGRKPENGGNGDGWGEEVSYTLTKTDQHAVAHTFKVRGGCDGGGKGYLGQDDAAFTISTSSDQHLFHNMAVRRLTPIECERLQGFPDNFTNIPGASDTKRYKALGNSMAVPVMRWIGERIEMVSKL